MKIIVTLRRTVCEVAVVEIEVPATHDEANKRWQLDFDEYEIQEAAERAACVEKAWEQTEGDPTVNMDWEPEEDEDVVAKQEEA